MVGDIYGRTGQSGSSDKRLKSFQRVLFNDEDYNT